MRTIRSLGALAFLTGSALFTNGCAPAAEGDTSSLAFIQREERGGDSSGLQGVLHRENGCTFLEDPQGDRWVPIFPNDTALWENDELVFQGAAADVLSAEVGDTVMLGGGRAQGGAPEEATIPPGCQGFGFFWVNRR
ncbi:hypothetical protein GCM10027403_33540 [Arthrobacter tecti]